MMTHWLGHLVISAVVRGVVYAAAFRVFHDLSPDDAVGLAVLVICGVFIFVIALGLIRRLLFRGYRRW